MPRSIQRVYFAIPTLFALWFTTGCGSSEKSYIPATTHARAALDTALKEWKSGSAHATVKGFSVPIDVFDARWQRGKKLETYEILREEKSEGPKLFVVKMKLDEDKEEKEVQYYVVGKSPLLIFRDQDYQKATGTGG